MPGADDKHDDESGVDWLESQLGDDETTEAGAAEATEADAAEAEATEVQAVETGAAEVEPAKTDPPEVEPAGLESSDQHEPRPAEPQAVLADNEPAGASAVPVEAPLESWPDTPVDAQRPPTEDEAATAILDSPVPAQSALPLPVPPPVIPAADPAPPTSAESSASSATAGVFAAPATLPATAYVPPAEPKPRIPRLLLWILGAILALAVLVALFFLGQRLAGGNTPAAAPTPTATPSPSATPTPTPTPTPIVGPRAPGVHEWDQLGGGECLQPYVSPWEEEFTVVDCAIPHAAQLVYRGSYAGDATTVFPGEAALASQINLLCSAPGVIDLAAARAFPDLQVQGSFPVTNEQWTSGQRNYYCFVSRAGGEPLTASVAGPGPAPAG